MKLAPGRLLLRFFSRNHTSEIPSALREQIERNIHPFRVRRGMPLFFARQSTLAESALGQMSLEFLFPGEIQFAVEVERQILLNLLTSHAKSPNAMRIFCVARNKQFLAASSVTPSASPMARSRMP